MPRRSPPSPPDPSCAWDTNVCNKLIEALTRLRADLRAAETQLAPQLALVHRDFRRSARNFAHYLALRQHDLRPLQEQLAWIGVSSLGRAESHVLANLDKVLGILHHLVGRRWQSLAAEEPVGYRLSRRLLEQHTHDLLGPPPPERAVRIMVTLPSEAAADYALVRALVDAGMDIARINCAHDDVRAWQAMARHVRRAARTLGRPVRLLVDLGGPKLRTCPLPAQAAVHKLRPRRDDLGRVVTPARLGLYPVGQDARVVGSDHAIGVDPTWLADVAVGDRLVITDTRGARRKFRVVERHEQTVVAECEQSSYLMQGLPIAHRRPQSRRARLTTISETPRVPASLLLKRGDILWLTREEIVAAAPVAAIGCTLPEVFTQVNVGDPIWFDDGRIGGEIVRASADHLEIRITHARDKGERLVGDKGINLPESPLTLPALTDKDIADIAFVAAAADLVALSFVQQASDIESLRRELERAGRGDLGIVLKIETKRAFANLPALLFAAMTGKTAGLMIARGDLAVECGYERLAEVQEEILWAAEAAHLPVIWATQVLETQTKTGLPSRAEITDAAMAERAECVMLNKGPHVVEAIRTLDDILRRMQAHQAKKRPLLRALSSWRF